jgi:hypothetical protein
MYGFKASSWAAGFSEIPKSSEGSLFPRSSECLIVSETVEQALQVLIGKQLSSVEFVHDYVQIRFDGHCLTIYSSAHTIAANGFFLRWGQPGYRDALINLITHTVREIEMVRLEQLSLTFDDDSVWSLSFRDSDFRGPEVLMLTDESNKSLFVL